MQERSLDPIAVAQEELSEAELDPAEEIKRKLGDSQANEFAQHLGKLIADGTMSLAVFRALPKRIQRMYKNRNIGRSFHVRGRPMSHTEIEIYKKHRRKRKRKNRMERRARAEMYRRQR